MPTIQRNLTGINRSIGNNGREWIVVHNVGTEPTYEGAAYNNTQFFASAYRGASAHYFIDEGDVIWQCVDDSNTSWAVGDAASRNGCYNSNSISIEVCGNWEFSGNRRANLRWLVQRLMAEHGIDASHIIRHWDVTYKQCPAYYAGAGNQAWNDLHAYITEAAGAAGEDDDMTPDQENMLEECYNRLTRTDTAGHDNPAGHDLFGRIQIIENQMDAVHNRVTRTDAQGHDNPAGHDLYGRVNIIETAVRKLDEKLDKLASAAKSK